ncbi:hypothetical protein [Enterococcus faecium]|uniref:hypothetical protein n=1 Tax=Enterococcus faecium TaxID=1352 RepID=UPI001D03C981|nr:hypothetical protein [Enterococcus faecium]
MKIKWGNYEGPAWEAPTSGGHLVYRLYNKGLRDHHYTASWDEVKWLTKNYGWTYEGPAWRSAEKIINRSTAFSFQVLPLVRITTLQVGKKYNG